MAIASFLTTRWSVGLTQNPPSTIDPTFGRGRLAQCGSTGNRYVSPYRDLADAGAAGTIGHIAWFLESNPRLLTAGELGVGHEAACFGQPRVRPRGAHLADSSDARPRLPGSTGRLVPTVTTAKRSHAGLRLTVRETRPSRSPAVGNVTRKFVRDERRLEGCRSRSA